MIAPSCLAIFYVSYHMLHPYPCISVAVLKACAQICKVNENACVVEATKFQGVICDEFHFILMFPFYADIRSNYIM